MIMNGRLSREWLWIETRRYRKGKCSRCDKLYLTNAMVKCKIREKIGDPCRIAEKNFWEINFI